MRLITSIKVKMLQTTPLLKYMKNLLLLLLICYSTTCNLFAQEFDNEADIKGIIEQLFTGMFAADSSIIQPLFHKDASMKSIVFGEGQEATVQAGNPMQFMSRVGNSKPGALDERLGDMTIKITDGMAQVWVPYVFFLEGKFSHCGTNAFHLIYSEASWKILHITDTRNFQNCETLDIEE